MKSNFRTLNQAVEFYKLTSSFTLQRCLQDQLLRAASSIALNLAEGDARRTTKDRVRFFYIAMGSLRECQAILLLAGLTGTEAYKCSDRLGAQLYQLIQNAR